ncbi:MAG: hypothetical protein HC906_06840 [Bacteroidales bacterium]|nr:hypothetical protein [Bacteroidales bacterium]
MKKILIYSSVTIIVLTLSFLSFYLFFPTKENIPFTEKSAADSIIVPQIIRKLYDIPMDSFNIEYGKIKRNQNLSEIFDQYNLPDGSLNQVLNTSSGVFDLRK